MSCPCKKCILDRAGPFEIPHATITIKCRECGDKQCPRAEDHNLECAGRKVVDYGF